MEHHWPQLQGLVDKKRHQWPMSRGWAETHRNVPSTKEKQKFVENKYIFFKWWQQYYTTKIIPSSENGTGGTWPA